MYVFTFCVALVSRKLRQTVRARSHLINARTSRKGRHLQDETVETQPNHDFPPDSITADLWFCCHKTIYEITSSNPIRIPILRSPPRRKDLSLFGSAARHRFTRRLAL